MSTTETTSRIADNIRAQMAIKRISQVKLGEKLGFSYAWVNRRANGETDATVPELEAIAQAIGVPIGALLEGVVTREYPPRLLPTPTPTTPIGSRRAARPVTLHTLGLAA